MWPAVIALLGSLASTGASIAMANKANKTNMANTAATNAANLQLAGIQNAAQLKMWQLSNEYNAPVNQARRLRGLGLSQSAIAQSVSGIPAEMPQSANLANQQVPPTYQMPDLSSLAQGFNIIGAMREYEMYRKDKADADIREKENEYAEDNIYTTLQGQKIANKLAMQEFEQRGTIFKYTTRTAKYEAQIAKKRVKTQELANQQAKINYDILKQRFGFLEKMNDKELEKMNEEIKVIQKEYEKKLEEIKESKTRQAVNNANVQNIKQDTQNKEALNDQIVLDNYRKALENAYIKHGSPTDVAGKNAALITEGYMTTDEVGEQMFNAREYLEMGYDQFGYKPYTFAYFDNFINAGTAELNKLGMHTFGYVHGFANQMRKKLGWKQK